MALAISTAAFTPGGPIPVRFTCQGEDISPALAWSGAPERTGGFALIVEDPDAGGIFCHWLLFNMPAGTTSLPENASPRGLPSGAIEGVNDFGRPGYGGPCPPPGKPHRYYFRLYALNGLLGLKSGASRTQALAAMKGLVLAEAQVMGTYQRR